MRWLLHGNLHPAVGEALRRHGHEASAPADVSLVDCASSADVFEAARKGQLDIITPDAHLAAAPYEEHIAFPRSIVYLHVGEGDVEQDEAVDRLFKRYKRLTPGRLYTVTGSRVKIRQLPTR
ncbi:MAG TPA: DUF5615 family PIN-like protein [Tepidisphaeraceae bacterium]|nr:DUF5615 family PIN-like protein [Tepidisphaeraceae bacterium]